MADPTAPEMSLEDIEFLKLNRKLAEDPATRKEYLKLLKKQNPNVAIPEVDIERQVEEMAKPHIEKLAKMEKDQLERDVRERIERQRQELREQGYSNDDIAAIEKLMMEEKIPQHATAAKFFAMQRQTAQPTPTTLTRSGTNKLPIDKKQVKEAGGVKTWAREEAHRAADDIKLGRVKLH